MAIQLTDSIEDTCTDLKMLIIICSHTPATIFGEIYSEYFQAIQAQYKDRAVMPLKYENIIIISK